MKRLAPVIIAVVTGVAGCSQSGVKGDGMINTEDRVVSDFSKVVVAGGYHITWSSGKPGLTISADQNLLPLIHTVVSGNTLRIASKGNLAPTKSITIVLSSDSLGEVELTGGNSFKASQLSGHDVKFRSTGASDISVDGSITNLEVTLTGASKLNAKSLKTETAMLSLVGASEAEVSVKDSLKASVTGAGSVTYSGDPKSVDKKITGAGSIRRQP